MTNHLWKKALATGALAWITVAAGTIRVEAAAVRTSAGFRTFTLPANDDGSTALVPIGFTVNFFGTNFNAVFVNNNGNVTFDRPLATFTPFGLTGTVSQIIAPFFADVDTRGAGSSPVTYGNDTIGGRRAFGVNWVNVGYFSSGTDRLNSFQLVLIDRSDLGVGNVDMEFNYDRIQWEAGSASGGTGGLGGNTARAGFSNGSLLPGTFFEFAGSGVPGGFLDSNPTTGLILHSRASSVLGRYLFRIRGGLVEFGGLVVSKNADPDPAAVGSNLVYTIRVDNTSTAAVDNVMMTDPLPDAVDFVSHATTRGTCTESNNVVVCNFGSIPAGGNAVATITTTPRFLGDVCNEVMVTATNGAAINVEACSSVVPARIHGQCITRNARYWFTHSHNDDPTCATMLEALATNGGLIDLGFLSLPIAYRNADNNLDVQDALIEALGLFWRSSKRTGDPDGTQSARVPGARLCRARKELAVEIIAAQANFVYLGTYPSDCYYLNGSVATNFPVDIVQTARDLARGTNLEGIRLMTANLRKFNNNGVTNNFFGEIRECDPTDTKTLRMVSRDPTSTLTCPAINDTCDTAELITGVDLPYKRSMDLSKFADDIGDAGCGFGGRDAAWRIDLPTADRNRQFTVDTGGSNIPAIISIWRVSCEAFDPVACVDGSLDPYLRAQLSFRTDGTNSYFIVVDGVEGAIGNIKVKVTSP